MIPENELSKDIGIEIDKVTNGPIVNQFFETSIPGIFACGNCLQVYDTVDTLAVGAKNAGKHAAKTTANNQNKVSNVYAGKGIRYVIPQKITQSGEVSFSLRVEKPQEASIMRVNADGKEIFRKNLPWGNPANMVEFSFNVSSEIVNSERKLEVTLDD